MHFVHFLFAINRQWVVETKNKKFIKQLLIFMFIVNADQYMLRARSLLSQHTLWIMQKKWKKKTFFISLHCYIGLYINSTIHVRAVNSALLIDAAVHCIVSEVINLLRINWNWFIHFICGVYLLFVRLADWQVNRFWNGFAGKVEASRASSRYISAMCTIHGQYHSKYLEYHSASIEFGSYNKEFVLSTLKKNASREWPDPSGMRLTHCWPAWHARNDIASAWPEFVTRCLSLDTMYTRAATKQMSLWFKSSAPLASATSPQNTRYSCVMDAESNYTSTL